MEDPSDHFRLKTALPRLPGFRLRIYLQPTCEPETGAINAPLTDRSPSPHHQLSESGARILTRCSSTTPFGLALDTDSPWADLPSPGNLRLSANEILTHFIATHSGIITSTQSRTPHGIPSARRGTLPYRWRDLAISPSRSLGASLDSRKFSAQRCSTGKLLRTF